MSKRWFTSDFHFGMTDILRFEERPFNDVEKMNEAYIRSCVERAGEDDLIIHVGDLCSFKSDRGSKGLEVKPIEIIKSIPATFINIRGNHDVNNKVFSAADSMRTNLGKRYLDVSICHYPTYDKRAIGHFQDGDIHICGHVHRKWKHCLDLTNNCLNVNVGVDAWNHKIVSEEELIAYISGLLRKHPGELYKCQTLPSGKVIFDGDQLA